MMHEIHRLISMIINGLIMGLLYFEIDLRNLFNFILKETKEFVSLAVVKNKIKTEAQIGYIGRT